MEKSQKVIGAYTILDMSKHLNVKQVAGMLEINEVAVWKAMRTGRLYYEMALIPGKKKHPKASGFIRVTTKEAVDEWRATINDKNYQTYNGRFMYNHDAGEMSSSDVREYMGGWTKNKLMFYVYHQKIKFTRKGYYYVFYRTDVEDFKRRYDVSEEKQMPMENFG